MTRSSLARAVFGGLTAAIVSFALAQGCAAGSSDDTGKGGEGGDGGGGTTTTATGGGLPDAGSDAPADVIPQDANIACDDPTDCNVLNSVCGTATCLNGFCAVTPLNEFGACDDGLFCTENDVCQGGFCVGGTQKYCPSLDECHLGVCDEALDTCKNVMGNDGAQCDDGDPCTNTGVCSGGTCNKGQAVDCSLFNTPCTIGVCDPNTGCKAMPTNEGGQCDDGQGTSCSSGTCQAGICVSAPQNEGATCFDFQVTICSNQGTCTAGACVPIPTNEGQTCDDGQFNPCTEGTCEVGFCVSHPKAEGDPCEDFDGNSCTGRCELGTCQSFLPANDGAACDDFQFCTSNTTCLNGVCQGGQPTQCAPPGGCWIGQCDNINNVCIAVPGNDGAACDDGNACTSGTTCAAGACIGGAPANEGGGCDDGASCTTGEFCTAGVCGGGAGPTIFFAEDFSDNAAGWTLGPEWQIGPAQASSGGAYGADPAVDHTLGADNGVAGVVIGGNASTNLHPYYYLESPAFNTAGAPGSVIFGYYRWLNSDYDPYMHNTVEVFNGTQWITLWTSGPSPGVQDSPPQGLGWTYIQFDVTAYKNAGMKVRFGFDIQSGGVYTIGSWNVDDVLVAAQACP